MKENILNYFGDPKSLEKLYRSDKSQFKKDYAALPAELKLTPLGQFWTERLSYETEEIQWGSRADLFFVILGTIIAGCLAKIPQIFPIDEEFFYPRNIGFIIFPILMVYFVWKNRLSFQKIVMIAGATLLGLVFINSLPTGQSDTLILSCVYLALLLWSIVGFAFIGEFGNNVERRLAYLKFNGDLVVITTLICISAGIMTGVTIGLFSVIGLQIENFWFDNVVVFGLPAAPIVGMLLIQTNPNLVGKVSPVIAKIFSPIVLAMLIVYLFAMILADKNPYQDREFLLIFNALLVGVMAIIFFSIAETPKDGKSRVEVWILFLLSAVTLVVNVVAVSAITFRISEWGITPNRAAVFGSNVLILIHLLLVAFQLFRVVSKKGNITAVGNTISFYLPVYAFWTIVVVFLFPMIFGFK